MNNYSQKPLNLLDHPSIPVTVNHQMYSRYRHIKDFISKTNIKEFVKIGKDWQNHYRPFKVLIMGRYSDVEKNLLSNFKITDWADTGIIDLNYKIYKKGFWKEVDQIWCLDVIEHLMNPLLMLNEIKPFIKETNGSIIITYPRRPSFLWIDKHFHEYSRRRFYHLVRSAGLKIIRYEEKKIYCDWKYYFTGVRPFLRLFFNKWQLYELVKDNLKAGE